MKKVFNYFSMIGVAIAILGTILAGTTQLGSLSGRQHVMEKMLEDYMEKNKNSYSTSSLSPRIDELINKKINISIKKPELVKIKKQLDTVMVEINHINDRTLALRQAINPTKPEEILKIARLTDAVNQIAKDLDTVTKRNKEEYNNFKNSLLRELETSNKATNLILVVLIPLVLNLLYNFWKDRKEMATNVKDDKSD